MTMRRKFVSGAVLASDGLTDRQIRVRASTASVDLAGDILVPAGCFIVGDSVPVFLDHDSTVKGLVGRAAIEVSAESVDALITFLPEGDNPDADDACRKFKKGFATDVSVGFDPVEEDRTKTGFMIRRWNLLELSCVGVGCNQDAKVTAKSREGVKWRGGASRDLPLDETAAWDSTAAEKAIFEWAGGDDFDPTKARKGFLVYDAAAPKLKSSYRLPIATVKAGRLTAVAGGIRSSDADLLEIELPDDVATWARSALAAYEAKMTNKSEQVGRKAFKVKGLYEVGELASLLNWLSWLEESVEWEAEMEADGSPLPDMLGAIMIAMGEALIMMTVEEVKELLGEEASEATKGKFSAKVKDLSVGLVKKDALAGFLASGRKSGRAISQANLDKLSTAHDHLTKGVACIKDLMDTGAVIGEPEPEDPPTTDKAAPQITTKAQRERIATALSLGAGA